MVRRKIRRLGAWLAVVGICIPSAYHGGDGRGANGLGVVECAIDGLGVYEQWGNNRGPEIDAYNRLTGAPLASPWCGSSVAMDHYLSGHVYPKGAAFSPNWFPLKECIYFKGKKDGKDWQPGDCVGFYFGNKKRIAHIETIESADDKWVRCIGGNTNDNGNGVQREGDRKMRKKRLRSSVHAVSRWWDN